MRERRLTKFCEKGKEAYQQSREGRQKIHDVDSFYARRCCQDWRARGRDGLCHKRCRAHLRIARYIHITPQVAACVSTQRARMRERERARARLYTMHDALPQRHALTAPFALFRTADATATAATRTHERWQWRRRLKTRTISQLSRANGSGGVFLRGTVGLQGERNETQGKDTTRSSLSHLAFPVPFLSSSAQGSGGSSRKRILPDPGQGRLIHHITTKLEEEAQGRLQVHRRTEERNDRARKEALKRCSTFNSPDYKENLGCSVATHTCDT